MSLVSSVPLFDSASIIENIDEGVVVFDKNWNYVYLNKKAAEMFGLDIKKCIGKNVWKLFPYLKTNLFGRNCLKAVKENISLVFDYHSVEHKRWYENKITPFDGGVIIFFRDISDKKKYQEGLEFLAEAGRVLSSSLDYEKTLGSVTKLIVPAIGDWFGVDLLDSSGDLEQVVIGHVDPKKIIWAKKLRKDFPPDLNVSRGLGKVLKTGNSEFYPFISDDMIRSAARSGKYYRLLKKVGFTSIIMIPLVANNKVIGALTLVMAESKRLYTEADLYIAKQLADQMAQAIENARTFQIIQRLATVVETSDDAIFSKDIDGHITSWNKGAERLYGYKEEEVMGVEIDKLIMPEDKITEYRGLMQKVREGKRVVRMETVRLTKDKKMIDVSITVSPLINPGGEIVGVSTIARNITDLKEIEKRKDTFIGVASHELKTPITSMKAFTQILINNLDKYGIEDQRRYLSKLNSQMDRMIGLVNELLDLSRIQSGKLELQKSKFDLNELIWDVCEDIQRISGTHKIVINSNEKIFVTGDKNRIGQVMINLLNNAIKYSPGKDKIVVECNRDGEAIVVSVRDFGIGVDKKYHDKVFERFFRSLDVDTHRIPGLGVGLFISSEIIKRHGGRIWVENAKNIGSIFKFTIPV